MFTRIYLQHIIYFFVRLLYTIYNDNTYTDERKNETRDRMNKEGCNIIIVISIYNLGVGLRASVRKRFRKYRFEKSKNGRSIKTIF